MQIEQVLLEVLADEASAIVAAAPNDGDPAPAVLLRAGREAVLRGNASGVKLLDMAVALARSKQAAVKSCSAA